MHVQNERNTGYIACPFSSESDGTLSLELHLIFRHIKSSHLILTSQLVLLKPAFTSSGSVTSTILREGITVCLFAGDGIEGQIGFYRNNPAKGGINIAGFGGL